jgi:hypothetical protein
MRLGDATTDALLSTAANAFLPGAGALLPMATGGGGAGNAYAMPGVTVSPAIQTQVSPQISPSFVQQMQPQNSPVSTGATQNLPTTQSATGSPDGSAYPGSPLPSSVYNPNAVPYSPLAPYGNGTTQPATAPPSFFSQYKMPILIGLGLVAVALATQTSQGKAVIRKGRERLRPRKRATA